MPDIGMETDYKIIISFRYIEEAEELKNEMTFWKFLRIKRIRTLQHQAQEG